MIHLSLLIFFLDIIAVTLNSFIVHKPVYPGQRLSVGIIPDCLMMKKKKLLRNYDLTLIEVDFVTNKMNHL